MPASLHVYRAVAIMGVDKLCAIPIILGAEFYDNFTAKLQIGNKAPLFHSKSLGKKVVSAGK